MIHGNKLYPQKPNYIIHKRHSRLLITYQSFQEAVVVEIVW